MIKSIKAFFLDMVSDTSGHINSKIVMGILSFIVAVVLAALKYPMEYPIMFLTFSSGCFGFSCFDNKSAFQFKSTDTKTETVTRDINTTIDATKVINNTVNKITNRRGKKK